MVPKTSPTENIIVFCGGCFLSVWEQRFYKFIAITEIDVKSVFSTFGSSMMKATNKHLHWPSDFWVINTNTQSHLLSLRSSAVKLDSAPKINYQNISSSLYNFANFEKSFNYFNVPVNSGIYLRITVSSYLYIYFSLIISVKDFSYQSLFISNSVCFYLSIYLSTHLSRKHNLSAIRKKSCYT